MIRRGWQVPGGRKIERVAIGDFGESKTKQEFVKDCDINEIVRKFQRTGDMSLLQRSQGYYADVSNMPQDYLGALRVVREADAAFMNLPASLREKFKNNPAQLESWLLDSKNHDEARELGLLVRKDDLKTKTQDVKLTPSQQAAQAAPAAPAAAPAAPSPVPPGKV